MIFSELFDGKYKIVSLIGAGGCGRVYLAENVNLGELFAIKEIPVDRLSRDIVEREVESLKRLRHPALPRVFDVVREDEAIYIIEDFIEGVTVEKALADRGAVSESTVVRWGIEICDIMIYLHSQKPEPIIYRDLKPANIIIDVEGSLKLVDFGAARQYKSGRDSDTVYIGTRGYAAPEQFGFGQTSIRTDVYSFGMTMTHMLTGERPMQADLSDLRALAPQSANIAAESGSVYGARNNDTDTASASTGALRISRTLAGIIDKCVQPEPKMRYDSFLSVQNDLRRAAAEAEAEAEAEIERTRALAGAPSYEPAITGSGRRSDSLGERPSRESKIIRALGAYKTEALDLTNDEHYAEALSELAKTPPKIPPEFTQNRRADQSARALQPESQARPSSRSVPLSQTARQSAQFSSPALQSAEHAASAPSLDNGAPSYLLYGRCVTLSIVGDAEFACELAYRSALRKIRTLVIDLDFERNLAGLFLGLEDVAGDRGDIYERGSLRRAAQAVIDACNGDRVGLLSPGAGPFSLSGDKWPDGLQLLHSTGIDDAVFVEKTLSADQGRFFERFLIEMTARFDLCVILTGGSPFSVLSSICFRVSHNVVYAARPDSPGIAAFNAFSDLAERVAGAPVGRTLYVAWKYDDSPGRRNDALAELGAGRALLGGVRSSKRRDAARASVGKRRTGVDSGKPCAHNMEKGVQKDYDDILSALEVSWRK